MSPCVTTTGGRLIAQWLERSRITRFTRLPFRNEHCYLPPRMKLRSFPNKAQPPRVLITRHDQSHNEPCSCLGHRSEFSSKGSQQSRGGTNFWRETG